MFILINFHLNHNNSIVQRNQTVRHSRNYPRTNHKIETSIIPSANNFKNRKNDNIRKCIIMLTGVKALSLERWKNVFLKIPGKMFLLSSLGTMCSSYISNRQSMTSISGI